VKGRNHRLHIQGQRLRRQRHVRNKLFGTAERPRLAVFRSSKHIYAQVINDDEGKTLAAAFEDISSQQRRQAAAHAKRSSELAVGKLVAERAKAAGIDKVCFDRRSYKYHGRIQALADAAREAGLQF